MKRLKFKDLIPDPSLGHLAVCKMPCKCMSDQGIVSLCPCLRVEVHKMDLRGKILYVRPGLGFRQLFLGGLFTDLLGLRVQRDVLSQH